MKLTRQLSTKLLVSIADQKPIGVGMGVFNSILMSLGKQVEVAQPKLYRAVYISTLQRRDWSLKSLSRGKFKSNLISKESQQRGLKVSGGSKMTSCTCKEMQQGVLKFCPKRQVWMISDHFATSRDINFNKDLQHKTMQYCLATPTTAKSRMQMQKK